MKKTTAIIETGSDGRYSIYIPDDNYPYGVIGTGGTVKEAIDDFYVAYNDIRAYIEEDKGEKFIETEFVFKYDVPSFLQAFAYAFTLAGLERITGVNQAQLGHYISGYRKPSEKTVRKIEAGIHEFCERLGAVQFV